MSPGGRLLAVAERLVQACPARVAAETAVTGSVGAGLADGFSDLELLFLVDDAPDPLHVGHWLESAGATNVLTGRDLSGTWAWCLLDGVEVEPYWGSLDEAEREVTALVAGDSLEHGALAFGHVLTHSIVLCSAGAFLDLAARLASYPEPLRGRLIESAVRPWEVPSPRLGAAMRGDRFPLQWFLEQDAERVLRVVFALNRRWELPRWKWLAAYVPTLELAPARLLDRVLRPLLEEDALVAVRAMNELVLDTLELVPADIDVGKARRATTQRLAALGVPA